MKRSGGRRARDRTDGESADEGVPRAWSRRLLPSFVRRRAAAKFALALFVVVALVVGFGALSYVQIQSIIEDDAENTLRSSATLQADSVGEWVAGMRTQSRVVASAAVFEDGTQQQIRRHLRTSAEWMDDDVVGVHYVNLTTGTVSASTSERYDGRPVDSVAPAWRAPIRQVTVEANGTWVGVSDTAYERNGRVRMAFASPVRGGDGVVVVTGDIGRDFEQLHETRPIVTTRVLNEDGVDVFSPRRDHRSDLVGTPAFEAARAGETRSLRRDEDVLALAPVPNSGWVVVTEAPASQLYQAKTTVGRNVVALVGAVLVTLVGVGALFYRGTIVPLEKLRARTRAMERGDLDVDLTTHREDEVGRLFDSFASMRDALREQIAEANEARVRAERSKREVERQNDRLDRFASTVSHDLRNPLGVAQGYLDLALSAVDERVESGESDAPTDDGGESGSTDGGSATTDGGDAGLVRVRTNLRKVADAHERIEVIIDDVLDLTRRGAEVENPETVDVDAVARDAWDNVDHGSATLTVAGSRSVDADRDRLLRAFENLFRNALEHGAGGGDASVDADADAAPAVEVGTTDDGFYVADDGPGVPSDVTDSLFEYGQTSSESGTGLGLSIVRTIAEAHGWTVAVDREYESGARFVFTVDVD